MTNVTQNIMPQDFDDLDEAAIRWHSRLTYGEPDEQTKTEFATWLQQSAENAQKYQRVQAFMQVSSVFTNHDYLKEQYRDLPSQIAVRENHAGQPARLRFFALGPVLAMLLFVFAGAAYWGVPWFLNRNVYAAAVGEHKDVVLADGSQLLLNTNTILKVEYSDTQRLISLGQGQARFVVAPDTARPFKVQVRDGVVTALGTEFDVYLKETETQVSLLSGRVKVDADKVAQPAILTAEADKMVRQISMSGTGLSHVKMADRAQVDAWRHGKFILKDEPLSRLVAEVNRYSSKRIVLASDELGEEIIGGMFPTETEAALVIIKDYFALQESVNEQGDIILSPVKQGRS